jgi:hypothetical protein
VEKQDKSYFREAVHSTLAAPVVALFFLSPGNSGNQSQRGIRLGVRNKPVSRALNTIWCIF